MKVCTKCKEEKELINFHKQTARKDGCKNVCKICVTADDKIYSYINREKKRKTTQEWLKKNKEKSKEYKDDNKEKINAYRREYLKKRTSNEPLFKLRRNIGSLIYTSIKRGGYNKKSKSYEILGCSFKDFKIYLEKQFSKGMSWKNSGEWHLDHIYPVSLAKDEEELIKLNHYTNFQPLWAIDNIKKGNKIIEKQLILI